MRPLTLGKKKKKKDRGFGFKEEADQKPAFYHVASRNRQSWLQKTSNVNRLGLSHLF